VTTIYVSPGGGPGISGLGVIVRLAPAEGKSAGVPIEKEAALCVNFGSDQPAVARVKQFYALRREFRKAVDYRKSLEDYEDDLKEYLEALEKRAKENAKTDGADESDDNGKEKDKGEDKAEKKTNGDKPDPGPDPKPEPKPKPTPKPEPDDDPGEAVGRSVSLSTLFRGVAGDEDGSPPLEIQNELLRVILTGQDLRDYVRKWGEDRRAAGGGDFDDDDPELARNDQYARVAAEARNYLTPEKPD